VTDRGGAGRAEGADGADRVAAAWLALQQEIAGRAAHEIRNVLNGVAVNLEVVRARSSRGGSDVSAVASFAASAAERLEGVTTLTESLLALARAPRQPVDVVGVLRSLAPLVGAGVRPVQVVPPSHGDASVRVPGEAARLLLAAGLLAATRARSAPGAAGAAGAAGSSEGEEEGPLRCAVLVEHDGNVRVRWEATDPADFPPDVALLAAEAGVRLDSGPDGFELTFPVETR
jgi:hypothetical protein